MYKDGHMQTGYDDVRPKFYSILFIHKTTWPVAPGDSVFGYFTYCKEDKWLGLCYQLLNRRRKHKPNPYVECTNVRNIFIKCTHLTKALFKVTYKAFKLYICTALCFPENQIDYHCLHHVLPVAVIFIYFFLWKKFLWIVKFTAI